MRRPGEADLPTLQRPTGFLPHLLPGASDGTLLPVALAQDSEDLSRLVHELNSSLGTPARAQPAGASHAPPLAGGHATPPLVGRLDEYLQLAVSRKASDLLLVAGFPPAARINGALFPLEETPLGASDTRSLALQLIDEAHYKEFQREKASDFTFERAGIGRFRCDLHHQRGSVAVSIRILPAQIPTLDELNLPSIYTRLASLSRGLVLFCGPTGCGKSTSMAALVDIINRNRSAHIVTIEDPLEYLHRHNRSLVEQVEVRRDALSFASALRHALRQNPDVILVGEMLDLETISIALTAAETGHLVLSTLHTSDACQTVDRIVDVFPETQQNQIRQQLSLSLAAVAVQTLLPASNGAGRLPACEVMLANDAIRNLIRTGKNHLIYSQLTLGRREGMLTMEESLAALVRDGKITRAEALLRVGHREEFEKLLA